MFLQKSNIERSITKIRPSLSVLESVIHDNFKSVLDIYKMINCVLLIIFYLFLITFFKKIKHKLFKWT